jgi:bifunctional non-homologous end joining protein LigD
MARRKYGRYAFESSNEDKVLFPESRITKGQLIDYYENAAEYMLGHLRDRPLSMHRFPDGIDQQGFYEKKLPGHFPGWIGSATIRTSNTSQQQVVCNNQATLAYLANQACITPHAWLSLTDDLDKPDQMIFDLDPPKDGHFDAVRQAATWLKAFLEEHDIGTFVKTTGSTGLHVMIPLKPDQGFDRVREVAQAIARRLAERHPEQLTTAVRKNKRRGRLFLDTARNAYGQTAVVPYAVRAKPGAPVATPLTWQEIDDGRIGPQSFTIANIFSRLEQVGDLWSSLKRHRRSLDKLQRIAAYDD